VSGVGQPSCIQRKEEERRKKERRGEKVRGQEEEGGEKAGTLTLALTHSRWHQGAGREGQHS
jgi:hypothetical protein